MEQMTIHKAEIDTDLENKLLGEEEMQWIGRLELTYIHL